MVRICKNSFDLLQFPNFNTYPMLWQFWWKKEQRTLGAKIAQFKSFTPKVCKKGRIKLSISCTFLHIMKHMTNLSCRNLERFLESQGSSDDSKRFVHCISFKTNVRIYTNFDEWKQPVLLSIRHFWIHSSSRIWMPQP
jgi:hypothetical protein